MNAYVHNVYTTLRMHVVSLHCRTPSITKNSSSFSDAYTSDNNDLRREVEREGERREKGNRKGEG